MKALVVGYGSIGQRHARLLGNADYQVAIVTQQETDHFQKFQGINEALDEFAPDYVVISNRTSRHLESLISLTANGYQGGVLVEKPLFDTFQELPQHKFAYAAVGYNLRFHPLFDALRQQIADQTVISAHAYVGQHLPDWRPGRDYQDSASANRAAGGGVLRDLSHELDYLCWLLGPWRSLTALGGHFSDLAIDTDDVYSILFRTERCPVVAVHLNYLDRRPRRQLTLQTKEGTISADLIEGTLETPRQSLQFDVARDETYASEHRALNGKEDQRLCSLAEGLEIVAMIDAAEKAAETGAWIQR